MSSVSAPTASGTSGTSTDLSPTQSDDSENYQYVSIDTQSCGAIKVYIQGNLENRRGKTMFLTCHDIGANHSSFYGFISHPSMAEVKERSIFLHVCLPGQDDNDTNLPPNFVFPKLDTIGKDLISVLNNLELRAVVAIGDGAGANIMTSFAVSYPSRCYGVILIRLNPHLPGRFSYLNCKYIEWKMGNGMSQEAWDYLVKHRFGKHIEEGSGIINSMKEQVNAYNLSRYMHSYFHRNDLTSALTHDMKVDVLLVVGDLAVMSDAVSNIYHSMNRSKTTLLVVDDVADVLDEAPLNLSRALILFCRGVSLLCGVNIPGIRRRHSSTSSEEREKEHGKIQSE